MVRHTIKPAKTRIEQQQTPRPMATSEHNEHMLVRIAELDSNYQQAQRRLQRIVAAARARFKHLVS